MDQSTGGPDDHTEPTRPFGPMGGGPPGGPPPPGPGPGHELAPTTNQAPYGMPAPAPAPASGAAQQDPILLWIGDIGVSQHWVVTPNGSAPLAGSQWIVTDRTHTEERIPGVAIVLAIIFFVFCLLGLLFLLMKERRVTGYAEVTVRSGNVYHLTQLPVRNPIDVEYARRLVHQAQSMAYAQGPR